MKKLVALVLVVILTLSVFTVSLAAEGKTFDVKMLEGKDGYEYDKFDKDWSYYQAYLKKFNDARVVIGLQVDGDAESVQAPELYCWIRDAQNKEILYEVTEISVLIGDDIYYFETVFPGESSSSVLLGTNAKPMLTAMSQANTITVRLGFKTGSIDIEIPKSDYKTTLKVAAQTLLDCNIWDYVDPDWLALCDLFTIEVK